MYCSAQVFARGADFEIVIAVTLPALALLRFEQNRQHFADHALKKGSSRFGDDGARLL